MAVITYTPTGSLTLAAVFETAFGGAKGGSDAHAAVRQSINFASATSPTITGFLYGEISSSGGASSLRLANADPFQAWGDSTNTVVSENLTVSGSKCKIIYVYNSHASLSVSVERLTGNGFPILEADGDSFPIPAGGFYLMYFPSGTAAITSANDGLLLTASGAGALTLSVLTAWGP